MQMKILIIVAPVILTFVWLKLDASPSLYFYDIALSLFEFDRFASLKTKTVWVTGASSGIGAELVCQLVKAEVGHVDQLESVIKNCKKKSPGSPTSLSVIAYDALSLNSTANTVRSAMDVVGNPVDILFLNSGRYQLKPALKTSLAETRNIMRVNFEAPVELAQTLMEMDKWKQRGYGQIVITSSIMGRGGHSLSSSYTASKHALHGYFHSLSAEEFKWLRINIVCPGAVATNMWNALDQNLEAQEKSKMKVDRVVSLLLTGMVGPYALFYEMWISKAPGILWITLASYAPSLHYLFIHVLGVARLAMFYKSGGRIDALDVPEILRTLIDILRGE